MTPLVEDGNVLRFHVDYYKPDGREIKPGETLAKAAVVNAILDKHDAAISPKALRRTPEPGDRGKRPRTDATMNLISAGIAKWSA